MDDVHKPHNLSAVVRSCDAVGVLNVHAVTSSGDVRLMQKTAGGNRRWTSVHSHESVDTALETLRGEGFSIVASVSGNAGVDYRKIDYTRPSAIVIGGELRGLSAQAASGADIEISIPMQGMVESLNVSVAAALVLFEAQRQRMAKGMYEHSRLDTATYDATLLEWTHPKVAAYCRTRQLPYPKLDAEGNLVESPIAELT